MGMLTKKGFKLAFTRNHKICIVGLGYVGLPLALAFAEVGFQTVGFDKNKKRILALKAGIDHTGEVHSEKLSFIDNLEFTDNLSDIAHSNFFIVCVPTPVDQSNVPDLSILKAATETVGAVLKKDDMVIFESTVYPGVTEDICVPILSKKSNLTYNKDFYVGYSPERINPGDKTRGVKDITKVVSCSSPDKEKVVVSLYESIISAGVFLAKSIKVAEAAKVIENTQRDVNIALINELSILFSKLNINTNEVLEAAGTKWNFLNFHPGLVGGHCIGVDPYYLTHKAHEIGYHPEIISAGRRVNDGMAKFVVEELIKKIFTSAKLQTLENKVLILGSTFKENCPDIRNSKVFEIGQQLKGYGIEAVLVDPLADLDEIHAIYNVNAYNSIPDQSYDAVIMAVPHTEFQDLTYQQLKSYTVNNSGIIFDLRGTLDHADVRL